VEAKFIRLSDERMTGHFGNNVKEKRKDSGNVKRVGG
jgi:hypothetical protein